jgi:hypothetical protein
MKHVAVGCTHLGSAKQVSYARGIPKIAIFIWWFMGTHLLVSII